MGGLFVVFEGPEGAGKSTQVARLAAHLTESGTDVVATREPGGSEIGESIRSILLAPDGRAMLPETEALLYAAARAQHVGELIQPALERGAVVLCDRFVDSSLAYQSGGLGLPMADVEAIQPLATRGIEPDLRILLDLPVEVGLSRRLREATEVNRLDMAGVAFHRRVRSAYLALAVARPDRWVVLDATAPPDRLGALIAKVVERMIGRNGFGR